MIQLNLEVFRKCFVPLFQVHPYLVELYRIDAKRNLLVLLNKVFFSFVATSTQFYWMQYGQPIQNNLVFQTQRAYKTCFITMRYTKLFNILEIPSLFDWTQIFLSYNFRFFCTTVLYCYLFAVTVIAGRMESRGLNVKLVTHETSDWSVKLLLLLNFNIKLCLKIIRFNAMPN